MVPTLAGLPQEEVVALLPKLLDPLPLFGAALHRILLPLPSGDPPPLLGEIDAMIAHAVHVRFHPTKA